MREGWGGLGGKVDRKELREQIMRRYAKTLAYLAASEAGDGGTVFKS